jgi:hypothetical protein
MMLPRKKEVTAEDFLGYVAGGDYGRLDAALKDGFDINSCGEDGMTPLMIAVLDGNPAMVDYLLGKGADINSRQLGKYGIPHHALSIAYSNRPVDYGMVEHLLARGAKFDRGDLLLAQTKARLLAVLQRYEQGNYTETMDLNLVEALERFRELPPEALLEMFEPLYLQRELEKAGMTAEG